MAELKNWEIEILGPLKPEHISYALIIKDDENYQKCDRQTLLKNIEDHNDIEYVATPNSDRFFLPGTDLETYQPTINLNRSVEKFYLVLYLLLFVILIAFDAYSQISFKEAVERNFFYYTSLLIGLVGSFLRLSNKVEITENDLLPIAKNIRFSYWLKRKKEKAIYVFLSFLLLLILMQWLPDNDPPVKLLGINNSSLANGEYYRLFTAILTYQNGFCFIISLISLFILGNWTSRIAGFSYFLIVFFISGLIGNLLSAIFPSTLSDGSFASILGLLGFLLVVGIKYKDNISPNLYQTCLFISSLVFALAIFNIFFPHLNINVLGMLGGFLSGIIIASIAIRFSENQIPFPQTKAINNLGVFTLIALIVTVGLIFIGFNG